VKCVVSVDVMKMVPSIMKVEIIQGIQ